jgi:chromosome segregation ATPase
MREQNSTVRTKLERCERRNEALVSEVARLGSVDSRMRIELDREKRDASHWRERASELRRQLIEARTELSAKKGECEKMREECRQLRATVDALTTPLGWRGVVSECRNENWRLKQELDGFLKRDMNARTDELAALREEVCRDKPAGTSIADRRGVGARAGGGRWEGK